ncbi:sensor histidine kinase [Agitococcus lubricus]|uniref:histidine kinase n=1 Tax=Agitococcus lubricus TaxID=1077255 RepID=A0A2T5J1N4_9GAMM|nr:ATP-binding protein [Agitococcus lubricus]PTQ90355.1 signal transduction histidine kinase [Agitococcus lubricus]
MFRTKLLIVFIILAFIALLQGSISWWAINTAVDNVQRGRVASDLMTDFVELASTKQELRTWLNTAIEEKRIDLNERKKLQQKMQDIVSNLEFLTKKAATLDAVRGEITTEDIERVEALNTLKQHLQDINAILESLHSVDNNNISTLVLTDAIEKIFIHDGDNAYALLSERISKERLAVVRERAAADASLTLVSSLALGTTILLALLTSSLALYFARALRQPLAELSDGAYQLQQGNLQHRIPDNREDEFSLFARRVNQMAAELDQHRKTEVAARQHLEELVQARTNELQNALETLQKLDTRRRQLFADISHELRTPTTAIRGEAEITLRGRDKPVEDYKSALQRIVETSKQLATIIDDLLTMARSDIDMLALERVPMLIAPTLQDAILQVDSLARIRQVNLQSDIEDGVKVLGDAQRLRQLFIVLLNNAICYSYEYGKVFIDARKQEDKGSRYWLLSLRDQGIGIPPDDLPYIFERNFRSPSARQHRPDGNGLGLSIAAALVRAHGGHIEVQSQTGQGTTIYVRLPMYIEPHILLEDTL